MKESFPSEYRQVRADAMFSKIFDIFQNKLCYSATMIHSIMCRQVETAKLHELWFIFGKRPLRFSLQEFHAVTDLKYQEDQNCNVEKWVDDNEFWSKLLKSGTVICFKDIRDKLVAKAKDWTVLDRVRLCYLCVIAGVLLVRDEKKPIPHTYIKLLMDFDKLRAYPWGLDSFDHLVKEIKVAREKLKNPRNYGLNGFSFAFQIWIMEAIPVFGTMCGEKFEPEGIVFLRCSNWYGSSRISYPKIRHLDDTFGPEDKLYSTISSTYDGNVIEAAEFRRTSEVRDERVDRIMSGIKNGKNWSDQVWPFDELAHAELFKKKKKIETEDEEMESDDVDDVTASPDVQTPTAEHSSASRLRKGKQKHKFADVGAEERKHKLMCQRSASKAVSGTEEMKSFFLASFGSFESNMVKKFESVGTQFDTMEQKIHSGCTRVDMMEKEIKDLKDAASQATLLRAGGEPSKPAN